MEEEVKVKVEGKETSTDAEERGKKKIKMETEIARSERWKRRWEKRTEIEMKGKMKNIRR